MKVDEIQCVLVGQKENLFSDLVEELKRNPYEFRFIEAQANSNSIVKALRKYKHANFVFISEKHRISLEHLSDLIWQNASDAIVVILSEKAQTTELKLPYNNSQFFRLNFEKGSYHTRFTLKFLIELTQTKFDFKRCKRLLSVCEKRSQWLVDSSREAIAYISRDIHLYANSAYLKLFQIENLNQLQTVSVKDLILDDEYILFQDYKKKQSRQSNFNQSVVLSMKKYNGVLFRANIYAVSSVFRGQKCYQLWVQGLKVSDTHAFLIDENETTEKNKTGQVDSVSEPNPFAAIVNQNQQNAVVTTQVKKTKKRQSPASILKAIIKREEAVISTQRLTSLKTFKSTNNKLKRSNYLLALSVPQAQKTGVDDLLASMASINHKRLQDKFWDRVKMTRLLQTLVKKDKLNVNLFIRLNIASLSDPAFIKWLIPGLDRLGTKTSNLVFILPSSMQPHQRKTVLKIVKVLRSYNIKIAQDNFRVSDAPIAMLKQVRPDYVRLSLPWVRQIEGNESREIGLSSVIRQLENNNIQVIAPCSFSKNMRKLFVLSGSSFCQESTS